MHRFLQRNKDYIVNNHAPQKYLMKKLKKGQTPETLFITCSDSRLSPHDFTQSDPGELFTLRNAGNTVEPYNKDRPHKDSMTLEYAVEILNINEIVICGHHYCGAMQGLLNIESLKKHSCIYHNLEQLLYLTDNMIIKNISDPDEKLEALVRYNLKIQTDHLLTHPFIKQRWHNQQLKIYAMVFDFVEGDFTYSVEISPEEELQKWAIDGNLSTRK